MASNKIIRIPAPNRNPQPREAVDLRFAGFIMKLNAVRETDIVTILSWIGRMNQPSEPVATEKGQSSMEQQRGRGVTILFGGLIVWTAVIAVGTFWTDTSTDFRRSLIVVGTMGTFLGVWAIALWQRKNRR